MRPGSWVALLIVTLPLWVAGPVLGQAPKPQGRAAAPVGTLTVAVATFGNERWLPHLYVGAEDVVLKPMYENLLTRDPKTGELSPMLAERWKVADGGRTWTFYLRKGVQFHGGRGEVTTGGVKFTLATLAPKGAAHSPAPAVPPLHSLAIEGPST